VLLGLAGCTGARANSHYRYPREVAGGRPSTCPDVRMPPLRDGNVSPDAARCSFADANGARVTHLAGKVLAEGGPGEPGTGVAGVQVRVHALTGAGFDPADPGPRLARTSTDAQGNYSLRGVFLPAEYAIVVLEPSGETLAVRLVRVEANAVDAVRDLHVQIPLDPRLKAEAAEPPAPRSDPRLRGPVAAPSTTTEPAATPPAPAADPAGGPRKPAPAGVRMRPPEPGAAPRP